MKKLIFILILFSGFTAKANVLTLYFDSLFQPVQQYTISGCDTIEIINTTIYSVSFYTDTIQFGQANNNTLVESDTVIGQYSNGALGISYLFNPSAYAKLFVFHQIDPLLFVLDILPCFTTTISREDLTSVKLYPNPTEDEFSIVSEEPVEKIEVYSLLGTLIFCTPLFERSGVLRVRDLPEGNYLVKIKTMSGNWVCKKLTCL